MVKDDLSKACFELDRLMELLFVNHEFLKKYISYTVGNLVSVI